MTSYTDWKPVGMVKKDCIYISEYQDMGARFETCGLYAPEIVVADCEGCEKYKTSKYSEKINLKCSKVIGDVIKDCNWDDYDFEAIDTIKVGEFEYNKLKYGKWIEREEWFDGESAPRKVVGCSMCGHSMYSKHDTLNFCPLCGAKMSL